MQDEYDFSNAKRAKDVPHLAKLQAETTNKVMIALMLDDDIFEMLHSKAKTEGIEYQTLINRVLREELTAR